LTAEGHQLAAQPSVLVDPAPRQETTESIAGGRTQARECAYQQLRVERHGAGAGQQGDTAQAEQYAEHFRHRQRFGEEHCANDHTHHRGGRVENGRIAGGQKLRRQCIERERDAGIDHPEHQAQLQLSPKIPADTHHHDDRQQAQAREQHAKECRGKGPELRCDDSHE